jgi:hypothetical protein
MGDRQRENISRTFQSLPLPLPTQTAISLCSFPWSCKLETVFWPILWQSPTKMPKQRRKTYEPFIYGE